MCVVRKDVGINCIIYMVIVGLNNSVVVNFLVVLYAIIELIGRNNFNNNSTFFLFVCLRSS